MSFSRLLFIAAMAALLGFGLFAFLAYRSSSVIPATADQAWSEFQSTLADLGDRPAIVVRDGFGQARVNLPPPDLPMPAPTQLRALAFLPESQALVRADVPYWFFRLKGPFVNIALRDTGYDLEALGLDAGELAEFGPGLVIDDHRRNGDRILIWLE